MKSLNLFISREFSFLKLWMFYLIQSKQQACMSRQVNFFLHIIWGQKLSMWWLYLRAVTSVKDDLVLISDVYLAFALLFQCWIVGIFCMAEQRQGGTRTVIFVWPVQLHALSLRKEARSVTLPCSTLWRVHHPKGKH